MGEVKCAFLYGKPHRFEAFKRHEEENRAKKERKTGHEKKQRNQGEKAREQRQKDEGSFLISLPFLSYF